MPLKNIQDDSGNTMELIDYNNTGLFLPIFGHKVKSLEENVSGISQWKCKPNDVFICATPKAGTHWIWEVVSMLRNDCPKLIASPKEISMLEVMGKELFEIIDGSRVFNTHLPFKLLPDEILEKNCKIIYLIRNPKDTAVSHYHHSFNMKEYSGDWSCYFNRWLKGDVNYSSWFDYQTQWERDIENNPQYPIHIVCYEEMKENPSKTYNEIAKFLEITVKPDTMEEIVKLCDFQNMKKDKFDFAALKCKTWSQFRKGQVGDWKNMFTVAQSELFDKIYEEKMKKSSWSFRYIL